MTSFHIPPDDPVVIALPTDSRDPATRKIVRYLKRHGFTTVSELVRKTKLTDSVVRLRVRQLGLSRRRVVRDINYWHSMGYSYGRVNQIADSTLEWLSYHNVAGESFAQTACRILRGDTKPHPDCGCSFCLRSRG